jgi:hypothetical protein
VLGLIVDMMPILRVMGLGDDYSVDCLTIHLQLCLDQLDRHRQGEYISPRVLRHLIAYLSEAVEGSGE